MSAAKVVSLTGCGRSVLITDADPEDALLLAGAREMLAYARGVLDAEGALTAAELRCLAQDLACSLRAVLDVREDE